MYLLPMQSEYIQLCKTLYSLLQDSPDEHELFRAMGLVANSLLGTGEENVQATDTTATPELAESAPAAPLEVPSNLVGSVNTVGVVSAAVAVGNGNLARGDNMEAAPISDSNSDVGVTAAETVETRTSDAGTRSGMTTSVETSVSGSIPTDLPTDIGDSFEQVMANAEELEEKWFLTFEQFVGALQQQPFLCQFFAEQNSIDLSGTSVDPVLNPYTRTILATTSP
jgi:hypothetical protein